MRERLGFLHYVAVACIAITALFEALQQALKDSPDVRGALQINLSGSWNYLPLILLMVGAGAWAAQQFFRPNRTALEAIDLIQKATADLRARPTLPSPAPTAERIFLDSHITPKTLDDLTKGRTSVEAGRLIAPYVGRWMRASGKVANVT